MDFLDYCISTKNYSAISAIKDYTKTFGTKTKIALATSIPAAIGTTAVGLSDTELGKKLRGKLGIDEDKLGDIKNSISDKYDELNDSYGREIRSKLGMNTLRDKMLDLKDGASSTWDKIKDYFSGDNDDAVDDLTD